MVYQDILNLLGQKRSLFLEIEAVSEPMQVADADALAAGMQQRQALFERVAAVDAEINTLVAGDEAVLKALHHQCDLGTLGVDLAAIYSASFGVKAVVNRILGNDATIQTRMELQKQEIQAKLEEIGNSGSAVAGQYYDALKTEEAGQFGRGIRKKI